MPQVPITLPDLGSDRVALSLWHVRPGDRVTEGDRVAEVLFPGAVFDVAAPASGVLVECRARPNDPLAPGAVLGLVLEEEAADERR